MTTNEKRAAIARVYSSESWQEKVARMSDNQVIAIYQKFLADGKFDKHDPLAFYKPKPLLEFVPIKSDLPSHDKKEEPAKEDFEQLAMDGFSFKKGR